MTAEKTLSRLLSRAKAEGDCLVPWKSERRPLVRFGGKMWYASRFVYFAMHGEIPEGMVVCHSCDNGRCVKPEHLFLGTQYDNIADAVKKGRIGAWANPHKSGFGRLIARVDQSLKDAVSDYCSEIGKSEAWVVRKAVSDFLSHSSKRELTHFLAKEQTI